MLDSVDRLTKRFDPKGEALSFDKDDEDTLDFVVGAANLRAAAFDIESQTKFQVKGASGCSVSAREELFFAEFGRSCFLPGKRGY